MDTTLPLPFLPSVDLASPPTPDSAGFTRKQLSYLGCVHFTATDSNIDQLMIFLQRHVSIEAYVDVSTISSEEDIITILDSGAKKVFATATQLNGLTKFEDRVIPILSAGDVHPAVPYPNGVLVLSGDIASTTLKLEILTHHKTSPVFLTTPASSPQEYVTLATESSAVPIIPFDSLTISGEGKIPVPALIASSWTSDRADGLIPTVVTDERGIALGLVYSSQESLSESLKTGTGVYQSRKRGLWYKGATSGDVQELVRISLDCDQDCLKFVVRQKGRGK
jgi:phosphoribosyl-ATP pyrophosphohydrolase/phosphoribosyl-AMP cyclohydrolase/histidinol dehydrogenase